MMVYNDDHFQVLNDQKFDKINSRIQTDKILSITYLILI